MQLATNFDTVQLTLNDLGVSHLADIHKLQTVQLTLPSLASVLGLATDKPFSLEQLDNKKKTQIPNEVIFVELADAKIDVARTVSFTDPNVPEQTMKAIAGKKMHLITKPASAVKSVIGQLTLVSGGTQTSQNDDDHKFLYATVAQAAELSVPENNLVTQQFTYTDPDGDGLYTADIITPSAKGEYEIVTNYDYVDPALGTSEARLTTIIDPSGYVYELIGGQEARVENATVQLQQQSENGEYAAWSAAEFSQQNPQVTTSSGEYSYLVPEGNYRLVVTARGYYKYTSPTIAVKQGENVTFNVKLISKNPIKSLSAVHLLLLVVLANVILVAKKNKSKKKKNAAR